MCSEHTLTQRFLVAYSPENAGESPKEDMALTLNPEANDVSVRRNLAIKINNKCVVMKTAEYHEDFELRLRTMNNTRSVCVNLDTDTREKLNIIEKLLKDCLPKDWRYKPLWTGPRISLRLSPFCKYYLYEENGGTKTTSSHSEFKQGHYVFRINVPSLYVGKHRSGEHCSLNVEVDEVYYRPDELKVERAPSPWPDKDCFHI